MSWPIIRRGPGGSPMHVETKWDPEFERDIPVQIICAACGAARALSTPIAVLVAAGQSVVCDPEDSDSIWIRQCDEFKTSHRCDEVDRG